jgi:hypothetical protein
MPQAQGRCNSPACGLKKPCILGQWALIHMKLPEISGISEKMALKPPFFRLFMGPEIQVYRRGRFGNACAATEI